MLLEKGDEAYNAGRYSDAVDAYSGARSLIPVAPATLEMRVAATQRYAQASVEYSRELSRKGDVAGAKSTLDKVLMPDVAPGDAGAVTFRAQLDDPIRTNPALDADHAKDVDEARRLLYTAEGAYNLGKYDQAKATYENVLRLDPFNTAARRGLEKVFLAISRYQDSAYDQARAEMLSQVEGMAEMPLDAVPVAPDLPVDMGAPDLSPQFIPIGNKLKRVIIPQLAMEQASLGEAIDFLRVKTADDPLGPINFTIDISETARAGVEASRFNLNLKNAPLFEVLKYITDATRTSFTTDDFSVIIRPLGAVGGELITRTYKVPPDFISSISGSSAAGVGGANAVDPFATNADKPAGGLLAKKLTAQEALAQQGVQFPQGTNAIFNPAINTLTVTNTPSNLDIISQIVDSVVQTEPVMVAVKVTVIRTEQRNLDELGFDWLLSGIGFDSDRLQLTGGSTGSGGDLSDLNEGATPGTPFNPVTAGNRSGQYAIGSNAIDDIIAGGSDRGSDPVRAPGVLKVQGLINGRTVTALMRGLAQKKGVDLMTCPSTVTRSGQASSVQVIREFIYPTEYEPPELPQTISSTEIYINGVYAGSLGNNSFPVTPATPTAFEKRNVGVTLEVLPTADANKRYVDLTLNPAITDFDGFVNYGAPISMPGSNGTAMEITPNEILMPVFSAQRVNTAVTVQDGATIVIGGLMQESVENVEDKTPVLGNLPVVGRLFQSKAKQPVTTAIVFLVNVQLMDPTGRPYNTNH